MPLDQVDVKRNIETEGRDEGKVANRCLWENDSHDLRQIGYWFLLIDDISC